MPVCNICHNDYTVASLSGHLKTIHMVFNVTERKLMLNLANKRTNKRHCPCPVQGCGVQGKFLERHLSMVHKGLKADEMEVLKQMVRRQETNRLLTELRDTNPEVPLVTTWDNDVCIISVFKHYSTY